MFTFSSTFHATFMGDVLKLSTYTKKFENEKQTSSPSNRKKEPNLDVFLIVPSDDKNSKK